MPPFPIDAWLLATPISDSVDLGGGGGGGGECRFGSNVLTEGRGALYTQTYKKKLRTLHDVILMINSPIAER